LTDYHAPLQAARTAWRRLEAMDFDDVSPPVLHEHIDQIQADLGNLHDAIYAQIFLIASTLRRTQNSKPKPKQSMS
jgi:hypothetical protein